MQTLEQIRGEDALTSFGDGSVGSIIQNNGDAKQCFRTAPRTHTRIVLRNSQRSWYGWIREQYLNDLSESASNDDRSEASMHKYFRSNPGVYRMYHVIYHSWALRDSRRRGVKKEAKKGSDPVALTSCEGQAFPLCESDDGARCAVNTVHLAASEFGSWRPVGLGVYYASYYYEIGWKPETPIFYPGYAADTLDNGYVFSYSNLERIFLIFNLSKLIF